MVSNFFTNFRKIVMNFKKHSNQPKNPQKIKINYIKKEK
jgi:hypothetical protein